MAMKREAAKTAAKASGRPCADNWLYVNAKHVVDYMTEALWDDGKPRETSTLTVFLEDGLVKVALNDRAGMRSLYTSAESVQAAIKQLDELLAAGVADWRAWRGVKKKV